MNDMDNKLFQALLDDGIEVLKGMKWLEVGGQLTPTDHSILHLACQYGSRRCVDEILSAAHEFPVLQINSRGETALHLAARLGHYGVVEALVVRAKSSDPDVESSSFTVIHNLIIARDQELETALHTAVRYNHEKVVELLVKEYPSYSYTRNKYGETPLYLAVVRRHEGVLKILLDNCESLTYDGPDGRTALHAAAMDESGRECAKLLLEKNKGIIRVADNNGWTVFHYMANNNMFLWLEYLLSVDRSVAYQVDKKYRRTALHVAAYRGHYFVVRILLKNLPDAWDLVDVNGQNIFHIAVIQDRRDVIKLILSETMRKFDIKNTLFIQRDSQGNTPLHLIAKYKFYIPELQHWNADWDVVNTSNLTPPEVLYQEHKAELIDEGLVGAALNRGLVNFHWNIWISGVRPEKDDPVEESPREEITRYRQMANTHMIVTALITTVALTAGFAMPGGFDGNQGPKQGSPVLSQKTAFKTFMVADTVALLFSISSLFLYFLTSFKLKTGVIFNLLISAIVLNVVSIAAMMLAFIAGTSAVLSHSSGLSITVSTISSLFLILVSSFCIIPLKRMSRRMLWRMISLLPERLHPWCVDNLPGPSAEYKQLWDV